MPKGTRSVGLQRQMVRFVQCPSMSLGRALRGIEDA